VLIRRLQESDIDAVVGLTRGNYDGVLAEYHSATVLAAFRAEITPQALREQMTWKRMFVVEEAGQVIATGSLADFGTPGEPRHVVSQFSVRRDLHRRGVGTRLLDHLVETAREAGADSLHVPSSRNAIPFYAHAGFTVDGLQPDEAVEITWMSLPLGAEHGRPSGPTGR
jgi:GNAT superfamily N-acetyltransferase